jgi:hypothetical protein
LRRSHAKGRAIAGTRDRGRKYSARSDQRAADSADAPAHHRVEMVGSCWLPVRSGRRVVVLGAVLGALIGLPGLALADDPSPSPAVFPQPHYLIWMDDHDTMSGLVQDQTYWLYPYLPDDGTNFVVPDGTGGVFHYRGHLVSGPYASDEEACPAMLAVGVDSLQTWATHAGESPLVVDCTRFLATPVPAVASVPASGSASTGLVEGAGGTFDPGSLGLAVSLIGLLLFGGGTAGVLVGRRRPLGPDGGPATRREADPGRRPERPAPDPCAAQAAAVEQASLQGRHLNGLLASGRRYEALVQAEVDRLAGLVLPGSVLLDLGTAAAGLSGGIGPKLAAEAFWGQLAEAVGKDIIKDLAKQGLGSAALDPGSTANEGGLSAAKATLLEAIRRSIVNRKFLGELSPDRPVKVFRDVASYVEFTKQMDAYGEAVAGPIADGVGALLDLYSGVMDGFALKAKLDHLSTIRDRIADENADLAERFEGVLEDQRFAADRLAHCRAINAPGWRP